MWRHAKPRPTPTTSCKQSPRSLHTANIVATLFGAARASNRTNVQVTHARLGDTHFFVVCLIRKSLDSPSPQYFVLQLVIFDATKSASFQWRTTARWSARRCCRGRGPLSTRRCGSGGVTVAVDCGGIDVVFMGQVRDCTVLDMTSFLTPP